MEAPSLDAVCMAESVGIVFIMECENDRIDTAEMHICLVLESRTTIIKLVREHSSCIGL
jgi:hypothetical protein